MPVVILVADGARPDALAGDLAALPALARLRDDGGLHTISSVFPSVTGPAYTPFLLGRHPGEVGIPGIRWYDRSRRTCGWPDYARSYVGWQMSRINDDLDPAAPTLFERVPDSVAALSVITRGLATERQIGRITVRSAVRAAATHFQGRAERWLDLDREVADEIVRRTREERPALLFAAFTGIDKASHARGHAGAMAREALGIVDDAVARLRAEHERAGTWRETLLLVVSDHGHAPVDAHEDLARIVADTGTRTVSHPWSAGIAPDAAVMVSGNAMAHVYLEPARRERPWWPSLAARWTPLADALAARASVDLLITAHGPGRFEVRSGHRGAAFVEREGGRFSYRRGSGDPLGAGRDLAGSADETWDLLRETDYPDALVQIAALAGSARAGDLILSAAPGWDLRARYEPIPHVSAHGALHREQMLVPLLSSRPLGGVPRRTTEVFGLAMAAAREAARS